jgi:hypothetical protein
MLSLTTLIDFIKNLRGVLAEPERSEIAHRLANLVSDAIRDTDNYKTWIERDRYQFLRACEIVNLERWVPDTLHVEPTKLAEFCNRWLVCNRFRLHNTPSAEWRPITPEQNALRVTMVEELIALSLDKPVK